MSERPFFDDEMFGAVADVLRDVVETTNERLTAIALSALIDVLDPSPVTDPVMSLRAGVAALREKEQS